MYIYRYAKRYLSLGERGLGMGLLFSLSTLFLQLSSLEAAYDKFCGGHPGVGYFLVVVKEDNVSLHTLRECEEVFSAGGGGVSMWGGEGSGVTLHTIRGWVCV